MRHSFFKIIPACALVTFLLVSCPPPSGTDTGSVPGAPSGIGATTTTSQNTISWTGASGATSYNLYWSTTSGVTRANGARIAGVSSPYTHAGRTNGTPCYYVVTAANAAGESVESSQVSATPIAAPTGASIQFLQQMAENRQQWNVNWGAADGATSYNIYYGTSASVTPSPGAKVGSTGATAWQIAASLSAYFIVTGVNAKGESAPSSPAVIAPPNSKPGCPDSISAGVINSNMTISWTAGSGETSYNLYWSTAPGVTKASPNKITGVTSPYVHSGLSSGTTYYYVATSVNGAGESLQDSLEASATAP